ncbi:MAG: fimbrillin family protein [Bacteroidales bacterium]|nr:fimbrillin family protein [Bacteroidales bacterium]
MKRYLVYIAALALVFSCDDRIEVDPVVYDDAVELTGVEADIDYGTVTKAAPLDPLNHVGRYKAFVDGDVMVLNTIKRTEKPIDAFSYNDIVYKHIEGGWDRDMDRGQALSSPSEVPDKIYWSDALGMHTFVGYSVPQKSEGKNFDWTKKTIPITEEVDGGLDIYYGSLGNPLEEGVIDHTTAQNIIDDDLLLTYDTEKVAEPGGSVALISFHHALANVRVVVSISGFSSSSSSADSKTQVESMELKDMLTMYKWRQHSWGVSSLTSQFDQTCLNEIYGGSVNMNQRKDTDMWIPIPQGSGSGVGKSFTFYSLAVPCIMGKNNPAESEIKDNLHITFKVKYPDPMKPSTLTEKTYTAIMPGAVEFRAGHCTTININLNHSNEQMTVGAEYTDWQFIDTPDESELRKNSTFLQTTARSSVTIADDAKATEEDATWLYKANGGKVYDVYGNDGTKANPYTISTASQLLSLAYEVKSGRTFQGQYVKLDANITMQPTPSTTEEGTIDWIQIGEAGKHFEGYFDGGSRLITCLKGGSFFHTIGKYAHIEQLIIDSSSGNVTSTGGFAEINYGIICAGKFQGVINSSATGNDKYVGGFVGENRGVIMASYHLGSISAGCNVGGIAGYNVGEIIASYTAGEQTAGSGCVSGGITAHQVEMNSDEWNAISEAERSVFGSKIDMCFYDKDIITPDYEDGSIGLTTNSMQKSSFVGPKPSEATSEADYTEHGYSNSLNYALYKWLQSDENKQIIRDAMGAEIGAMAEIHFRNRYYVYQPANYPWVY